MLRRTVLVENWADASFFWLAACMAALLGMVLGRFDPFIDAGIAGILGYVILLVMRQDELAAGLLVVVHLYVDWYLGLRAVALVLALILLLLFFLTHSPERPWRGPRVLWLWMLFLLLGLYPAFRGFTQSDGLEYYLNVIFAPFLACWLGTVLARDIRSVRLFLQILAALGALFALHTIIQGVTGILLFGSSRYDIYLAQVAQYALPGTNVRRIGSFFLDPNWNGAFFALLFFLPLGLFFESTSYTAKMLYFIELSLMLIALLFIFSNGSWVGFFAGFAGFFLLVGNARYRWLIALLVFLAVVVLVLAFPALLTLELQHALGPTEVVSRTSAWQTALNVISAHPWTGIGLGLLSYLNRAESYRVIAQYVPLAHPHDAYLELAALAGLPLLIAFMTLLAVYLWTALSNWALADARTRSLLGGDIAAIIALSINSISINGWTLAPLALTAWLILGMISSPLLVKTFKASRKVTVGKEQG
jgi:O-antigen ligase